MIDLSNMIGLFKRKRHEQRPAENVADPFLILRATIEASCQTPAVVLVSSVLPNDGKTKTSTGLAAALAKSGLSTRTLDGAELCKKSKTELERMFAEMRERYAFTIVDGCTLSDGALPLAAAADGVLLSVRNGRQAVEADREATQLLERFGARFIGVVATDASALPPNAGANAKDTANAEAGSRVSSSIVRRLTTLPEPRTQEAETRLAAVVNGR